MSDPIKPADQKTPLAEGEVHERTELECTSDGLAPSIVEKQTNQGDDFSAFDGFALLELLGDGGSATVYKALNQKTGDYVAVKIFKQTSSSSVCAPGQASQEANAAQMKRFEKELSTLRKLDCSNVVGVLGWGTTPDGAPYIVMQYVSGKSIKAIIDGGEVFPVDRTISIAREICRALTAAHTQEFIHRDLKPSNIIVNDKNAVKVVDFGIAKAMGIGIIDDTITQLGAVVGSPAYMSPEQCLGEPLGARSDIYSLGCTMYEMLTGFQAFASETTVQAIAKQINPDRSSIRKGLHATGVSPDVESVIMRCLEREPANRYQTVGDLDHDLSALQLNKPISNCLPASVSSKRGPFINATTTFAAVAAGAAAAVLLMGMVVVSNFHPPRRGYVHRTSVAPYEIPLHGVQLFNKSGKMIFQDLAAQSMRQAVMDAVKEKANLQEVNLQNANLTGIDLNGVNLSGADLTSSRFTQAHLTNVNLHGANLTSSSLIQAKLFKVDLSNAQLSNSRLTQCEAPDCNISGADLSYAHLTQAKFLHANGSNAIFQSANLIQAQFDGANLHAANFDNARLIQTSLEGADLSNASFANTRPRGVRIRDANLAGALLPNIEIDNNSFMRRMRVTGISRNALSR